METQYRQYISFADPLVAELCKKFSSDGKGVTYADAAAVTSSQFSGTFGTNIASKYHHITSFDEFQYFTGLSASNPISLAEFANQYDLRSIIIPPQITTLGSQVLRFSISAYASQCTTDFTVKILRTSGVITIGAYTLQNRDKTPYNFTILVPSALVESYKAASRWSAFADYIEGY